jgi:hypothetical protein
MTITYDVTIVATASSADEYDKLLAHLSTNGWQSGVSTPAGWDSVATDDSSLKVTLARRDQVSADELS